MPVLTLEDAKLHLNISAADTSDDAELSGMIEVAEAAITADVGPLVATPAQYRAAGGGRGLVLPTGRAVVSVQSVTPVGGAALDMTALHINTRSGVVEFDSGGTFSARAYDVAYTAGYETPPADLVQAVREMLAHLWATQRGNSPSGALPQDDDLTPDSDTLNVKPRRIRELIAPYRRTGVR